MKHINELLDEYYGELIETAKEHNKEIKEKLNITDLAAYMDEQERLYIEDIKKRHSYR